VSLACQNCLDEAHRKAGLNGEENDGFQVLYLDWCFWDSLSLSITCWVYVLPYLIFWLTLILYFYWPYCSAGIRWCFLEQSFKARTADIPMAQLSSIISTYITLSSMQVMPAATVVLLQRHRHPWKRHNMVQHGATWCNMVQLHICNLHFLTVLFKKRPRLQHWADRTGHRSTSCVNHGSTYHSTCANLLPKRESQVKHQHTSRRAQYVSTYYSYLSTGRSWYMLITVVCSAWSSNKQLVPRVQHLKATTATMPLEVAPGTETIRTLSGSGLRHHSEVRVQKPSETIRNPYIYTVIQCYTCFTMFRDHQIISDSHFKMLEALVE